MAAAGGVAIERLIADGNAVVGAGVFVKRLIADGCIACCRAGDRIQGAVANRHVFACARHAVAGGALHRQIADRRIVGAARRVLHGLIANRRVWGCSGRGIVQRLIADRDVACGCSGERLHGIVADGDIVIAG